MKNTIKTNSVLQKQKIKTKLKKTEPRTGKTGKKKIYKMFIYCIEFLKESSRYIFDEGFLIFLNKCYLS